MYYFRQREECNDFTIIDDFLFKFVYTISSRFV